ncbi:hydroxypyruvate isomerase family protein [Methylotuvimicrobium alcaliphilum]|uniref:Hydroxypyruvate isomerase n=1 Tax=Methylotuvimicrobium alcaliphilum (strain DSM 19304 / NCIMB 14124 / VKM B-2133 / 20Z) TaxID=1091494 RepID=G4T140_META2|nr:TIM barrel protein [Methylotuvimicrobium alcaliphilum]CCE24571.1 Hydroxypyruvate isomerase [Methylotuvimicrobium alcaliphilum 20Z]
MINFSANLSMLFTELPLLDRFDAAKNAGFSAAEIQFPYSESIDALRAKLDETGLQLVLFNVDADDLLQGGEGLAAVPEKRERFKAALTQTVDYIEALQPKAVNVLPGRCMNPRRLDDYLQTFGENLSLAADTFAPFGVSAIFEAINTIDMPGFIIHSGAQMLDWLERLNHPNLLLQVDIYHLSMMNEDPEAFIRLHPETIGHIQFADTPGRGQPGTGNIDFNRLFDTIRNSGYSGWTGAEYRPVGPTLDSLDWLEQFQTKKL